MTNHGLAHREQDNWQVFGITEEEAKAAADDVINYLEDEDCVCELPTVLGIENKGILAYKAFLYGRTVEMNFAAGKLQRLARGLRAANKALHDELHNDDDEQGG